MFLKSWIPPRFSWKGLALTTGVQLVLAWLPLFLQSQYGTYAVPFWPASGTALAAVLLGGPWMLVGIYLAFLLNGFFFNSVESAISLGLLASANVAEVWIAWLLLTRVAPDFRPNLSRIRDLGWFLLLGPWIPTLISSGLTQLLLAWVSTTSHDLWEEFAIYALGNATGILLVTPFVLVWHDVRSFDWRSQRGVALLGLLVVLTLGLFLLKFHFFSVLGPLFATMLIPVALYGVWQTGLRGSAVLVLASSAIYFAFDLSGEQSFWDFILTRIQGLNPDATPRLGEQSHRDFITGISMQLGFLGLMSGTLLPLGSVVDELRRKTQVQTIAMKALHNSFWSWNRENGLVLENPEVAALFLTPPSLFDPNSALGNKAVSLRPGEEPEFRSFWTFAAVDAMGEPTTVVGILQELSLHRERDTAMKNAETLDLEIQTLRSHLNPHLLFNCLTGLRGLIGVNPVKAQEFTGYLARFLREAVDFQSRPRIPVAEELKICRDFVYLEELRGREVDLKVRIDPNDETVLLPPLTLVTLLENAIKHRSDAPGEPARIYLESSRDAGGKLKLRIRQPGQLVPLQKQNINSGLSLIRRQFDRLMPAGASISLSSDEEGWVEACVTIPC